MAEFTLEDLNSQTWGHQGAFLSGTYICLLCFVLNSCVHSSSLGLNPQLLNSMTLYLDGIIMDVCKSSCGSVENSQDSDILRNQSIFLTGFIHFESG